MQTYGTWKPCLLISKVFMWLGILGSVSPVQTKFKRKQATLVQGTFLYNLITRISFRFSKLHLGSLKFIWNFLGNFWVQGVPWIMGGSEISENTLYISKNCTLGQTTLVVTGSIDKTIKVKI